MDLVLFRRPYLHSQLPLENTAFTIIANIFRFTTANPPYTNDFWKQDTYWLGILCKQIVTLYIYHYALVKTGFHFFGKRFGITSALGRLWETKAIHATMGL